MAAEAEAEGQVLSTFTYAGGNGNDIPQNATRVVIHKSVTTIPVYAFYMNPNIVELICHAGVIRIKGFAFTGCPRLKRIIIPGVEVVEISAFDGCEAVTDIECPKLERIEKRAFSSCESLSGINLPSIKVIEKEAFDGCRALTDAVLGSNLETIGENAFSNCPSLGRVTMT